MILVAAKQSTIKPLTRAKIDQLMAYLNHRDESGWFYGDKKQFEKRHIEIKHWLHDALEKLK